MLTGEKKRLATPSVAEVAHHLFAAFHKPVELAAMRDAVAIGIGHLTFGVTVQVLYGTILIVYP